MTPPPYEEIPGITRSHPAYLESTNEESAWLMAGMKSIILRTIGRKSGKVHKVVLPYWEDEGGHRIITASYAGGPVNPGWYHNLADREAGQDRVCSLSSSEEAEEVVPCILPHPQCPCSLSRPVAVPRPKHLFEHDEAAPARLRAACLQVRRRRVCRAQHEPL